MKNVLFLLVALSLSLLVSCNGGKKTPGDQKENNDTVKKVAVDTIKKENDLSKSQLKGKIKTYTENYFRVVNKSGEYTKGEIINKTTLRFNTKGYKTEEDYYNPDGSLKGKWIVKYDDKDNVIGMESYKQDGSMEYKYIYGYNDKGNRIWETEYNGGMLAHKNSYKYDHKGNILQYITYLPDGSVQYKSVCIYKFNGEGNKIEETSYTSYGAQNTLTYDDKGNRIGSISYESDGSIRHREMSDYNEKGLWLGYAIYNSDSSLYTKAVYKYNDEGDIIEGNKYRSDGSLERKSVNEYEYDKTGNKIKSYSYENSILVAIFEYEIEYYK